MNSSSQQHIDLLLPLMNVKLFTRLDGDHQQIPLLPAFSLSQLFLAVTLSYFFSLASFFMPTLFLKQSVFMYVCVHLYVCVHACVSSAIFLPEHSRRSDGHWESAGQQPWNKYGWSWVRWARIICFAICLCESVDVMTVVLPSLVNPLFAGNATEKHTYWT